MVNLLRICLFIILFLAGSSFSAQPTHAWELLASGLEYQQQTLLPADASLHLVKIDLGKFRLDLLQASALGQRRAFIQDLVQRHQPIVAINASFFDPAGNAMGLVIQRHRELNPLRKVAWGIFQVIAGKPSIIHTRDYRSNKKRELAIQTGPRLVIDKAIPRFKDELPARRSAVCVTPKRQVILAVASPTPITLHALAQALRSHCHSALNLDGGSSTQFYLKSEAKELLLPGREPVPNVLAVFAR